MQQQCKTCQATIYQVGKAKNIAKHKDQDTKTGAGWRGCKAGTAQAGQLKL